MLVFIKLCDQRDIVNSSFQEVAKVLLKHGAIVDIELGARKNKLTPLLIASSVGGLQFVRLLVSHDANPLHKGICYLVAFCLQWQ